MEKKKRKYSRTDRLILGIGFTILGLFVLSIAIPIIYVVLASFMDPTVLNNQGLSSDIKDWTLDAYNLSESEAYRRIQKYSMAKRKTIKEVAQSIIRAATK